MLCISVFLSNKALPSSGGEQQITLIISSDGYGFQGNLFGQRLNKM